MTSLEKELKALIPDKRLRDSVIEAINDDYERTLPVPKLAYSIQEVAQMLGVNKSAVCELIRSNKLASVKIVDKIRIPRTALETFFRDYTTGGCYPSTPRMQTYGNTYTTTTQDKNLDNENISLCDDT